jgi:ribosomal protein S18 acetylase RimI-like enzyme
MLIGTASINYKMKIKKVTRFSIGTYNAILKLLPQLDSDATTLTELHFREILKSEKTHLFVAELNKNQIVGMLSIGTYDIPTGTKVWIEDVVVDESQRGKGIGRELTLFAIDFARSQGYKAIELTSRPSRIAANELYRSLGFTPRETNIFRFNFNN